MLATVIRHWVPAANHHWTASKVASLGAMVDNGDFERLGIHNSAAHN